MQRIEAEVEGTISTAKTDLDQLGKAIQGDPSALTALIIAIADGTRCT